LRRQRLPWPAPWGEFYSAAHLVDVPYGRVEQIRALVERRHPEAVAGGQETRFPAFP
jgi:hypothetical protein